MINFNNYFLNLSHLQSNALKIKNNLPQGTMLCAMVKANAYGHGIKPICKKLLGIANFFGVATLGEAKEIREFDTLTPILIVGQTNMFGVQWCSENNVSITINTISEIKTINKIKLSRPIKIHFKINTGLQRFGFSSVGEFTDAFNLAQQNKNIIIEGIFTHFATKANDQHFIVEQHNQFKEFFSKINTKNIILHCCNSFACENFPQFYHQMVRCGFSLYGWADGFLPVLKISAKVLTLQNVKAGSTIGYDRTYLAKKDMKVAVVSLGYADGFDRKLSNRAHVLIKGQFAKIVGLVCMDVFMCDVTNIKNVEVGDVVTILGESGKNLLTPQYYAKCLKTSPYEILLKFNYKRMNVITMQ